MKTETLQCKAGHTWERPIKRGKKPRLCPAHQTQPVAPETPEEPTEEPLEKARKARAAKLSAQAQSLNERVQAILDNPDTEEELRRKLQYTHDVVTGRRQGNTGLMSEVRDQLVAVAERKRV